MKKNESPSADPQPFKSIATMHRWKFTALAAATLASVALYAPNALALALGPVTVQSALGEPLRAEIALPSITAAEAESLKVGPAPAETFRAQGMEYSGAVSQIQVALQKRPNGQSFLRVSSSRPVNEPFFDLIIDATWATGRITRSYTMLFDPPILRRPATVTAAPQLSIPTTSQARANATSPRTVAPAATTARPSSAVPASASADIVTVKAGDTAGRIANANRPDGVSLDQMLVAMLRANPNAFIRGNVNLVKAGAVLQMPNAEQAGAMSAAEARTTIAAQSRDFNSFRRKLAAAAPVAQTSTEAASRSASGKVQTEVQVDASASASPDKLTLSKGAVQGTQATPEALAQRKQSSEAAARVEELAKNISELSQLADSSTTSGTTTAATAGTSASTGTSAASSNSAAPSATVAPSIVVPSGSAATNPAPSAPPADSLTTSSGTGTDPAPTAASDVTPSDATNTSAPEAVSPPVQVPVKPPVAAPVPLPSEPSLIDSWLEDPVIPGIVLVLLLLLGYGGYRYAQSRREYEDDDSSFVESRLQPDSFFGASGGQQINTSDSASGTTGSSLAFSHSQLDAGGDVDLVAEADVYLAYGRDLQAEEILREAVRQTPDRLSVHTKLADIYAKRKDPKALKTQAAEIFRLTNGQGPEWNRLCELGRELDPQDRYYQPGGLAQAAPAVATPTSFAPTNFTTDDNKSEGPPSLPSGLDFDLDLPEIPQRASVAERPAPLSVPGSGSLAAASLASTAANANSTVSAAPRAAPSISEPAPVWTPPSAHVPTAPVAPLAAASSTARDANALDFSLDLTPETPPAGSAPLNTPTPADSRLMEFDMESVSLELKPAGERSSAVPHKPAAEMAPRQDSPFSTKLALAREFAAIGDNDGARTLLEEVVADSSGDLQVQARSLLAALK